MPERSTTDRGFTVYDEFTDTCGAKIRVQQSSSAEGPRIWIFAEHAAPRLRPFHLERLASAGFSTPVELAELASMLEPSPHLDVEQAKRLRDALDVFISENRDGHA
jgi:hypothetical protein